MEKIYMEDDYKKDKSYRRLFNFSIVLSFAVAIFAVFSIAAAGVVSIQGNGVSYAAPIGTTGESFTFNFGKNDSGSNPISIVSDGNGQFSVPLYLADNNRNTPIFCVEHHSDVEDGSSYSKKDEIEDYGLLYLLSHSYANGVKVTRAADEISPYVETWITQTAIWMYLYENDSTATTEASRNYISADEVAAIKGATSLNIIIDRNDLNGVIAYSAGVNLYDTYVKPLVDQAKASSALKDLSVTQAEGEISKTDDGKYYQSTLITVSGNPSDDFRNYDISFNGFDNVIAVDENGNELSLTNIDAGKSFYVRVPAEQVTDSVKTLTVNVVGHFDTLKGYYYTSDTNTSLQKVVSVTGTSKNIGSGIQIEFVGAPDTGMNTAQTIYFIGLIVLLCGVGIVYANAKPVETK